MRGGRSYILLVARISRTDTPIATYSPLTVLLQPPSLSGHMRTRAFYTTPLQYDHYRTLGVNRGASPTEIKTQFYALSKKFHPDLNRDDEGAKKKFQEVSEAWNVLGNDRSRRDYDRGLSMGHSGGGGAAGTPGYSYDASDNAARRARASYAWEYQRRRSDSNRSRSGAARAEAAGRSTSQPGTSSSNSNSSLFQQYAERQRRREEFVSSRTESTSASAAAANERQEEAHGGSGLMRFLQLSGLFTIIYLVGVSFAGPKEPKIRKIS